MTYNDLCAEVAALGFEGELEMSEIVLHATERALKMIFTERPMHKILQFYQNPPLPVKKIESLTHSSGIINTVTFNAKAYSFKATGEGTCRISDERGSVSFDFSGIDSVNKGFLYGEGVIEFLGNYSYTVYDLAIFDDIISADEKDIPILCDFIEYDVQRYATDFLSFTSAPENEHGAAISGASVCGGKMRIPVEYTGKIRLMYKSAPISISADEEIILPNGCEHLLPLLVAAYAWLDEDADKAQYYMSLYREAMAAVKFYDRAGIDTAYHDVMGWT